MGWSRAGREVLLPRSLLLGELLGTLADCVRLPLTFVELVLPLSLAMWGETLG